MSLDLLIVFLLLCLFPLVLYLLHQVRNTTTLLHEMEARQKQSLRSELGGLFARLDEQETKFSAMRRREADRAFAQLEAYLSLRDRLDLRKGLPYTKDWSASPDFLQLIVEHCLEAKPMTVLECSSGLTTLMLAKCCRINNQGRVYSLENGLEFAEKTRGHIERYELGEYASVIHAPLKRQTIKGVDYQWYALDNIPDKSIDMLVIDGPPGFIQKHSRYPALPLLFDKLADGCVVFMDDAAREDEREIAALWQSAYPEIEHRYVKTERGCSVFVIRKGSTALSRFS